MSKKGKLIVIDGGDGSGKATQTKLLASKLRKVGRKVKTIDFPQYTENFFGYFIGECLVGEHGDFVATDPYIASVIYAADRFESSAKIRKWCDEGYIVICDRYVSANQIHQGGKIKEEGKRKAFIKWLAKMEYEVFKIKKPDLVLYLDVPTAISDKLINKTDSSKKRYLRGRIDKVEQDKLYKQQAKESALKMVRRDNKWVHIKCADRGVLQSPEEISEKVITAVNRAL